MSDYEVFRKPEKPSLPLWFLDVDGVINCFPAPRFEELMASQEWSDALVDGYKIWWRRPVVEFINRMARERLAQPVWLTTWTSTAVTHLAPALDLDRFPTVVDATGGEWPDLEWWKWKRVQELTDSLAVSFVWTDDDLTPKVREAAQTLPHRKLILAPKSSPALEDNHLAMIEAFLKRERAHRD